jgi:hypothetical protein
MRPENTRELVDAWVRAGRLLETKEAEVQLAKAVESKARRDMGKWLIPPDAAVNELFQIWVGDAVLQICLVNTGQGCVADWRGGKPPTEKV